MVTRLCKLLLISVSVVGFAVADNKTLAVRNPHGSTSLDSSRTSDRITKLPGLGYNPGFHQYSGYLTVSEKNGRNIFYWYVESQNNPATDPVVLWTNGGPGCSGLIGLLEEHGPYIIDEKLQLSRNPFSWNKVANMLYIEQPAGTGFSFSKTQSDYNTGDSQAAKDNYELILAFLRRFPERKSKIFYIASESYGGRYMPQLALEILRRNTNGAIKFKGMMVGNPYVDPFSNKEAEIGISYFHGLLPENQYQSWQKHCSTPQTYQNVFCTNLYYEIETTITSGIDPYGLDYPLCTQSQGGGTNSQIEPLLLSSRSSQALQLKRYRGVKGLEKLASSTSSSYQPCSSQQGASFLNQRSVQRALHVNPAYSGTTYWSQCSGIVNYSYTDINTSQIQLYKQLVQMAKAHHHSLNMLIYSGDDDSVCATSGTQSWIWELGVKSKASRTWLPWTVNQQTAGYVTQFDLGAGDGTGRHASSLTFATVHGAGHQVPAYRPEEALVLFQKFLSGSW